MYSGRGVIAPVNSASLLSFSRGGRCKQEETRPQNECFLLGSGRGDLIDANRSQQFGWKKTKKPQISNPMASSGEKKLYYSLVSHTDVGGWRGEKKIRRHRGRDASRLTCHLGKHDRAPSRRSGARARVGDEKHPRLVGCLRRSTNRRDRRATRGEKTGHYSKRRVDVETMTRTKSAPTPSRRPDRTRNDGTEHHCG